MELGKQIMNCRQEADLSQEELAERIYVSRQTISNWENDKSYPDVNSLVLLSEVFHISLDKLIKGDIDRMREEMKIGIIGCGSMGRMLVEKFFESKSVSTENLLVANRTLEKIVHLKDKCTVCESNREAVKEADIVFLCVRPVDMKDILSEIKDCLKEDSLLVSLNGSIMFEQIEQICKGKIAKAIPSVTAEVNQSQTLVCYNERVTEADKECLTGLLSCMGTVIELPEQEMGMGSELVSCMPGFIAAIFQELCTSAKKHTTLSENEIVRMVLQTMVGTGTMMLEKEYSFEDVISRVATKGGITEEGTKVIQEQFPVVADDVFEKTLEKRRLTTDNAQRSFERVGQ